MIRQGGRIVKTRQMSRREFLSLVGAAGSAALLAACAPPATPEPEEKETPAAAEVATEAAPAEVVTIEFLGEPGTAELREEEKEKFETENPNIEWVQVEQPEVVSRLEQLLTLVAAGTPPDCARVESDVYRTFCKYELLLAITEELFDELGVEPPSNDPDEAWEWDYFLDVARELTVDTSGNHPGESGFDVDSIERWGAFWPTWWIPLHAAVQSNGADWVDPETGKIALDNPAAMEAIQRVADLTLVHQVALSQAAFDTLGMAEAEFLSTKKVGLYNTGSWSVNWLWQIEGGLGTGVLPKMTRPGTDMQAHLVVIVKETEHPDEAWTLVRFLASPWFQERYCEAGLWLPSQTALMTDEAIARWCAPPVHPPGYDLIVTEYAPKYGHYLTMPVGYVKAAETVLTPAFDQIWIGDAKAEDVLPEAVAEANRIMEEEQARPAG
jgi:ABC-type glycerol-3-phosphate transport system substrate-binding protein